MNLIYIVCDSLRADYLGCYGNSWIKTPNLDELAKESVLFENAYIEGFPTIPARYVFSTGKFAIPQHGWEPLKITDTTLAQILGKKGYFDVPTLGKGNYISALITDTYHLFKMNFHRGFHSFHWIRGQEFDNYITKPGIEDKELQKHLTPRWESQENQWTRPREWLHQYYKNIADRNSEEDYFIAKTIRSGINWLEDNHHHNKFYLYIDAFDPHEPWDPPQHYFNLYKKGEYDGPVPIWAGFTSPFPEDYTTQELSAIKAAYAGEVSFVDYWIGQLLSKIETLGLMDDTLVVLTSDHGTAHGEHGFIGKTACGYREVNRIPLIIRHPKGPNGKTIAQLIWAPDIFPTILDILDIKKTIPFDGKSAWPIIQQEKDKLRDFIICGTGGLLKRKSRTSFTAFNKHLPPQLKKRMISIHSRELYVTDGDWSYIAVHEGITEIYNLNEDPQEMNNLISECPDQAKEMEERVKTFKAELTKKIS
ncbi:MAG: sulfatase [Candidatus Ranarchaeia archaeon]|jgi:arylsulfatase A-like enzyme